MVGNDAGVGTCRRIVETLASEGVARLRITAVEVEFGPRSSASPAADARGRRGVRCRANQRVDDVMVILALDEEILPGCRRLTTEDFAAMRGDIAGVKEIGWIDAQSGLS